MIRINQLKLPLGHSREQLYEKAAKTLGIHREDMDTLSIVKQSVDARKKPELIYSYVVDIKLKKVGKKREEALVRRL